MVVGGNPEALLMAVLGTLFELLLICSIAIRCSPVFRFTAGLLAVCFSSRFQLQVH